MAENSGIIGMDTLINWYRIRMTCEQVDHNPAQSDDDKWARSADHWKCTLTAMPDGQRRQMTIVFSQGSGFNGAAPKLDSVLDCLASDASGVDNARDFEDWASEYGYDEDSRRAEKIYKATVRQSAKLARLLSETGYRQLLYDVERL
jgi:hypothetical protein